ncbi:hypothetical protein [Methylomonas koyamae]|uniref:hypothetical protein n=1 Tax=Methylomonas koyamae TaxID=702114 RepID=UPI000BDEB5B4|nr:hypothetical protein [Methylomonas koyamae]
MADVAALASRYSAQLTLGGGVEAAGAASLRNVAGGAQAANGNAKARAATLGLGRNQARRGWCGRGAFTSRALRRNSVIKAGLLQKKMLI